MARAGDVLVRSARADELTLLPDLERRASRRFHDIPGLEQWVDDITPVALVVAAHREGLAWVATVADELVGWCFAAVVDDSLFVEQIDVVPEFGRRGIGRLLIDTVEREAAARGLAALTLTTDAHVVWNRPWYEKLGFTVVPPHEQGPGLRAAFAAEAPRGLDPSRRVVMRRELRR